MKGTQWLVFGIVLLMGCSHSMDVAEMLPEVPKRQSSSVGWSRTLVVDAVAYDTAGRYHLTEGELVYSSILIFPVGQYYFPATRFIDGEFREEIYSQEIGDKSKGYHRTFWKSFSGNQKPATDETKIADALLHHIYFIDDGKIVFQKSYEEIGLDFSEPKSAFEWKNLQPILERLIREHVKSQAPETEE